MVVEVRCAVPDPDLRSRTRFDDPCAVESLGAVIREWYRTTRAVGEPGAVVLCIGTDRSTGDSLGPLVGSILRDRVPHHIWVFGDLDHPIHAANIADRLAAIRSAARGAPLLAVDACLGRSANVGCIDFRVGPLQPGTGVNKSLPKVGDAHLLGVVNVAGCMEYLVLQNTRLSVVLRMAEVIADALEWAFEGADQRSARFVEPPRAAACRALSRASKPMGEAQGAQAIRRAVSPRCGELNRGFPPGSSR